MQGSMSIERMCQLAEVGASVRAAPVPLSRSIKFPIFIFEKNNAHLSATWSAENLSPVTKRVGCKTRSAFGSNGR